LCFQRKLNKDKVGFGIKVVFSGFIDYPQISLLLRPFVRDYQIDLPLFQIIAVLVVETNCIMLYLIVLYHDLSLKIV
jgi:hypothetical protein